MRRPTTTGHALLLLVGGLVVAGAWSFAGSAAPGGIGVVGVAFVALVALLATGRRTAVVLAVALRPHGTARADDGWLPALCGGHEIAGWPAAPRAPGRG